MIGEKNGSQSAGAKNRQFMELVVPWPGSVNAPGWVNLHCHLKNTDPAIKGGKPFVVGWPHKTIDTFLKQSAWVGKGTDPMFFDVWYCTSQQRDHEINPATKKPKAKRLASNATWLKAIWIDCDIKPGDAAHYGTDAEASNALGVFCKNVGLPKPSAVVHSGGGLHVYWISDTAMSPEDWRPYAEGLKALLLRDGVKCDTGLTTDSVRLLRVPGTLNHKYSPPRTVELLHLGQMYDFPTALAVLHGIGPIKSAANVPSPSLAPTIEPGFENGPDPAFAQLAGANDLASGIFGHSRPLLAPGPVFEKCGFLGGALANGGKDYDNPLWNLSVLCTAFMENGNALAHKISQGHATYSAPDTQALYDRKVADRAERGIGYPSCAAIAGAGCKSCVSCLHRSQVKSPLNLSQRTRTATAPAFADPYDNFIGPAFPLDVIPPTLRKFVETVSTATGADASAVAMAALTTVSAAINAETSVRLGEGWYEKPIIWTVLVGPPSSMKSPIIEKTTRPLAGIDRQRAQNWKTQHSQCLQQRKIDKNSPLPSKPPRCLVNDATPEKVAEILARAPCGSLMVHDEIAGFLTNFDRYNSGSSRPFYLQAWNGGAFTKDRVGKGKEDINAEIFVENLALGILGGIQPERLTQLGDLTTDGLLQRFLPTLMVPAQLGDPYAPVEAPEGEYDTLVRSINAAPPRAFRLDEQAFPIRDGLMQYLHELERVDGFSSALLGAIGKLKGYFGRICLVLQVAENHEPQQPELADPSTFTVEDAARIQHLTELQPDSTLSAGVNLWELITRETAERSDKLIRRFLLPHLCGLYDVLVNGGKERERVRELANFVLSTDKERLRPSDFTAGVRSLRGEPDNKLREWVGRLCGMGWVIPEEGRPGAPTRAWLVAPGLRDHFAERRRQAQTARAEAHRILAAGGSSGKRGSV